MDRGVARPAWAEHVGAVETAECYVNSDAYGDRDEVVCVFSYAGQEQHALVVVVDYNAGGLARDGWVTSQVAKLLDYCRDGSGTAGPAFMQIDPPQARRILAAALAATDGDGRAYGEFVVPLLSRVHQGPDQDAAAGPAGRDANPGRGARGPGRQRGGPPRGLAQGPAGDAGGPVPRLGPGGGLVGPAGRQQVRRPHRRIRLRTGLRPAAAGQPGQGGDIPA